MSGRSSAPDRAGAKAYPGQSIDATLLIEPEGSDVGTWRAAGLRPGSGLRVPVRGTPARVRGRQAGCGIGPMPRSTTPARTSGAIDLEGVELKTGGNLHPVQPGSATVPV